VAPDTALTVPPTATAPALLLRPWTEEDIPAIVAAHRDQVIRRWLRHPISTRADAARMIRARRADAETGTGYSFAVLQVDPGLPEQLVGSVSLRGLTPVAVAAEVGYWVAAAARGRGVAPRSVDALCHWALARPRRRPLERLELLHSVDNHASCRVAEKTGFRLSAILPPLPPDFPDDGHLHIRPLS
jgi:RimJ/RimL family protein N-acetyltransferase